MGVGKYKDSSNSFLSKRKNGIFRKKANFLKNSKKPFFSKKLGKRLFIRPPNIYNNLASLMDQLNTTKSKSDNPLLLELNFENDTSLPKNMKKDDSATTKEQTANKLIKDDIFSSKTSENSFKVMENRRKTNGEVHGFSFKGNSPIGHKLFPQKSFNRKIEKRHLFKDFTTKKILPQIPENELQLPKEKSFKMKNPEEMTKSLIATEKKTQNPKIFIEIPQGINKIIEKESNSASISPNKLKSSENAKNNNNGFEANLEENNQKSEGLFLNKHSLLEKNVFSGFFKVF